jgi:L-ascorbate metabolism protein UlaG (beta-lactamase superfamily)
MDITYLGHSSFKIKTKTATVITDPFDPQMVGLKYSGVEGEIVTVSHAHRDHNAVDKVAGVKKVVEGPGEYEIMGVSIIGYPSFHDAKEGAERGKNTIYIIES